MAVSKDSGFLSFLRLGTTFLRTGIALQRLARSEPIRMTSSGSSEVASINCMTLNDTPTDVASNTTQIQNRRSGSTVLYHNLSGGHGQVVSVRHVVQEEHPACNVDVVIRQIQLFICTTSPHSQEHGNGLDDRHRNSRFVQEHQFEFVHQVTDDGPADDVLRLVVDNLGFQTTLETHCQNTFEKLLETLAIAPFETIYRVFNEEAYLQYQRGEGQELLGHTLDVLASAGVQVPKDGTQCLGGAPLLRGHLFKRMYRIVESLYLDPGVEGLVVEVVYIVGTPEVHKVHGNLNHLQQTVVQRGYHFPGSLEGIIGRNGLGIQLVIDHPTR
ncbi:hypothetical protein BaOVIS_017130 [Babesia ovis]|uniref:Uncharacterized protein n=1 Tax=Babesia ovis TaxID=5869 RepID=A0A9W5TE79_BABOV|nr:hypothetical protein BaOVIS_017130 [Babesia ovis]